MEKEKNKIYSEGNLTENELLKIVEKQKKEINSLIDEKLKYQNIFNNSLDGIYKSTPGGKFIEVNKALVEMLGYDSKEELLNIDIKTDLYFDIEDRNFEEPDEYEEKGAMFPMRKKDGSALWVEDSGKIITDSKGIVLFHEGFLRDASRRRRASQIQKALLKISQQGYKKQKLTNFIKFVMNELDKIINTDNFFVAFYNEEKQTINIPFISGEVADKEFPIGKSMTGYLIKNNKPLFLKSDGYQKKINSGKVELIGKFPAIWLGAPLRVKEKAIGAIVVQSYDDENTYEKSDLVLLEFVASHIGLALQRKKVENEMAMSKEILRKVLDNIPIGVFWKDRDSKFLGCNKASLKEMKFEDEEDVIGKSDFDLHVKSDAKKYRNDEKAIMLSGEARINYQETQLKKGKERIYITSKLPFFNEEGDVVGIVGTSDDITELKETEIKLKKATQEAIAANLSKSIFLSNMSHEIRTPMNAILGYSQLLFDDDNLTKNQKENLKTINKSGEHLLELINDILDMSKIEAGKVTLKKVDFNFLELLKEVEQLFKLKAKQKNIDLSFNLGAHLPKVIFSDESKVKQVIINLIGNALKFTLEGFVKVTVETGINNVLFVKVEDSGQGILKEEQEAVFKPFEQARNGEVVKGGTGLGLTISKKIAKLMDGDIIVKSEYEKGSEFIFSFKYLEGKEFESEENIEVLKVKSASPEMKDYKIAIVDDRFENRDILYKKLDSLGFVTRMAVDGKEAVKLYKEWKPDLILMDVVMPIMNGIEATRQILKLAGDHKVKIFVISASALESEQKEIMELGATIFIKKPIKFDELLSEMHKKAGVQFIYQNNQIQNVDKKMDVSQKDVPKAIKLRFIDAATEGDFMLLQDLLETLEKETNKSFIIIENYINEMEFEEIVNWLKA